jgi:hypothetical protein
MNGIENKPPAGGSISPRSLPQASESPARATSPRTGALDASERRQGREPRQTGAAPAGSIPEPPTGESEAGSSLGEATLEKAFEQMDSLEKQIDGLDPEKPGDQKKLMQIQLKLQRIQQVVGLINEIRKARHSMAMAVINNIN